MVIRLQQIFAHATTAQLSWHVQNFVATTRWLETEIFSEFEFDRKIFSEMVPWFQD